MHNSMVQCGQLKPLTSSKVSSVVASLGAQVTIEDKTMVFINLYENLH